MGIFLLIEESANARATLCNYIKGNIIPYRGFWRDTNLADLGVQGIPKILADVILVNQFPFFKKVYCPFIFFNS